MKICSKCKLEKPYSEFYVRKDRPCGYVSSCKSCQSLKNKDYHKKNAKKRIENTLKWKENNLEKYKNYVSSRKDENRVYQREYAKRRRREDIDYFMKYKWRKILYQSLRYKNIRKKGTTIDELGYTSVQLKMRIEFQFKDGMSWSNYGEWEIDHKKPVSSFRDENYKHINMLCNLQPLWKEENRKKSNKYGF